MWFLLTTRAMSLSMVSGLLFKLFILLFMCMCILLHIHMPQCAPEEIRRQLLIVSLSFYIVDAGYPLFLHRVFHTSWPWFLGDSSQPLMSPQGCWDSNVWQDIWLFCGCSGYWIQVTALAQHMSSPLSILTAWYFLLEDSNGSLDSSV